MTSRRTQVGIVGAGPAGLLLSHLLHLDGIDSVILERRDRAAIERTIRAGVLEQGTVDLLSQIGAGRRVAEIGVWHEGVTLRFGGRDRRIDFPTLTEGKRVMLYPQHEVLKDLIALRLETGADIRFEAGDVRPENIESDAPHLRYVDADGREDVIECDFIAGCDGTQGVCRDAIPEGMSRDFERIYPFGWFGILCEAPRSSEELIYALGEDGFALVSTRTPDIQRMYFQCDPGEQAADWNDDRIWSELRSRLANDDGWVPREGRIFNRSVVGMRSLVTEPMQYRRLFLTGDAAHVVPPTGAKGLNLAVGDVFTLSRAFTRYYCSGDEGPLTTYSERALRRVWKAQRFSWWMTSMLHRFPDSGDFQYRMQLSELDYVTSSRAASAMLAEQYVGLPFES